MADQRLWQAIGLSRAGDREGARKVLESIIDAARRAPTANNVQPWEFVVVTDTEKLTRFRKRLIFGNRNAPAAILVCGNPTLSVNPAARLFWQQDCSIATENILIAATSLGLGTVWVGVHPVAEFVQVVRDIVKLPKHVIPLCLIYVGYPAEEKPAEEIEPEQEEEKEAAGF